MFGWVRKLFAANRTTQPVAKFDHAQTTPQNYRHWANADSLGPVSSLDPGVRKILRERCRYEVANDPHLAGLVETMAYDTVGSGPRLQLQSDAPTADVRKVEKLWASWCRKTRYAERLRLMVKARRVDGEVYGTHDHDDTIPHPIKFRLNPFESDLVCEPLGGNLPPGNWEDGVDYDERGNARRYAIQTSHPGDGWIGFVKASSFTVVDAANVMHYFKPTRPGQQRGFCEFASALGTVAQLRRFGIATLTAVEFASSHAGIIYTDGAPEPEDEEAAISPRPMSKVYTEAGALLSMPHHWKVEQMKSEHPTTTYKEYTREKRNEIGRPVGAPENVLTGSSAGYNYSSGRLDHVPYQRIIWIDRSDLESSVVDHTIRAFLDEADKLGLIPPSLGPADELEWECQWDGFNSIDPYKDAQASELRMKIGLTTLSEECAADGKNYRDVLEQQAVEMKLRRELGLPDPTTPPAAGPAAPDATTGDDDPPDDNDDTELDRPRKQGRAHAVLV